MTAKRRSLADRNRSAIANPDRSSAPLVDDGAAWSGPSRTSTTATVRVTVRMSSTEWDEIRGAYLADWDTTREHDTFKAWATAALERHAWRTPADRATTSDVDVASGSPRMFDATEAAVAQVRAAMIADQRAGQFPTLSGWCRAALTTAAATARERSGGRLPTPPKRLPGRLI